MLEKEDIIYLAQKKHDLVDNCPLCHGTQPFCKCNYAFRLEINKASSQIPIEFRDFTLDKLTHPQLNKQKKAIQLYLDNLTKGVHPNLLLEGGPGLAKSAVACLILSKFLEKGEKVFYYPSLRSLGYTLINKMKDANSTDPAVVALSQAKAIVVDGVGYGFIREQSNVMDMIGEYVERRNLQKKVTIFVSGMSLSALGTSEATVVRIARPQIITFGGFNYVTEVLEKAPKTRKPRKVTKKVQETPVAQEDIDKSPSERYNEYIASTKQGRRSAN